MNWCTRFLTTAFLLLAASLSTPSFASEQDLYLAKNAPVIEIKTDSNGVDLTGGSYAVSSPLSMNAPAAKSLNIKTLFNGHRISFTLNYYLDDVTFTPSPYKANPGDPNDRDIKVHLGGTDRLFICEGDGWCNQVGKLDGSKLKRTNSDYYEFTGSDGLYIQFFKLVRQALNPASCDQEGDNPECNNAGYEGFAYASSVKFADGEKLTYDPYAWVITSNLGYNLRFDDNVAGGTGDPAHAGWTWLTLRHDVGTTVGSGRSIKLYKANTLLATLYAKETITALGSNGTTQLYEETDQAARKYKVTFDSDTILVCDVVTEVPGSYRDSTYLVPKLVTTPGGRVTTINYSTNIGPGNNPYTVSSVVSGGVTWNYNFTTTTGKSTNPLGGQTKFDVGSFSTPFPTPQNTCPMPATATEPTKRTDEISRITNYTYSGFATISGFSAPEANGASYTYDARGNVTAVTNIAKPSSGLPSSTIFQAGYDVTCTYSVKCNKPNWIKDAKNSQWDFEYSTVHGGVTKATLPADASGVRGTRRYIYQTHATSAGGSIYRLYETRTCISQASCANTSDEVVERFTYWGDTFLPLTKTVVLATGGTSLVTQWTYDNAGRKLTETDPKGNKSYFFYDTVGREIGSISEDPDGSGSLLRQAKRTTYDADDLVTKVEVGNATGYTLSALNSMTVNSSTTTTYDTVGRRLTETVKGSNGVAVSLTQYSYDTAGRLQCAAMRMNPAVYGSLPASACTLGTQGSNGPDRITKNVYDAAGQLIQVRKAVGTSIEIADVTNSYTANGKLQYVIDANGNKAKLEYDGFDRQSKWIFPSKTRPSSFNDSTQATALSSAGAINTGDYEQYTYDANGNRLTLRKRDGSTLSYNYDKLNRMTKKVVPERTGLSSTHTRDVFYGYDLRGLQTYARFNSATSIGITYAYDGFGRLKSETQNSDGTSRTISSLYDANANRTRVTHPDSQYWTLDYDGLNRLTNVRQTTTTLGTWSYNNRGLPSQLNWTNAVASANKSTFGYDNAGRLTSIGIDLNSTSKDVTWTYTRNPASQILTETQSNDAYSWDGHVNLNRSYTTNGLNQYTGAGSASFTYDANGNLTSDGTYTYAYDVENRLVSRTDGGSTITLYYDPTGRLYQVTGGTLGTQRFTYDGNALVAEYNGSGTMLRRYIHGSNAEADDPLVWYEGSAVTQPYRRYLHADPRGSIVAVTNYAGTSIATNTYDEYGIPDSASGNDIATKGRFRYTGQAWIPELGMYYYKARIYSPTLGRFLQTDPIGYEDNNNLYAYVANDPVNGIDPTGMECNSVGDVGVSCQYPDQNVPGFDAPKPEGFPDSLPEGCLQCHEYHYTFDAGSGGAEAAENLTAAAINNPTPGTSDSPATRGGTVNDAGPLGLESENPVLSVVVNVAVPGGGNTNAVVNFTLPGHEAKDGYVMQYFTADPQTGRVTYHVAGEGTAWRQSRLNPIARGMERRAWSRQLQQYRRAVR